MNLGRKFVAILMTGILIILTSCQIISFKPAEALTVSIVNYGNMIATTRSRDVGTDCIIIDEQALALASNPAIISEFSSSIIALINEKRIAAGLALFIMNTELCAAASIRAQEQEQKFSHTRPNGSEFWTVDSRNCFGECLSKGYYPNEVVDAWMNSPTHKSILLDTEFKTAGIGVYDVDGQCYIALEVGY